MTSLNRVRHAINMFKEYGTSSPIVVIVKLAFRPGGWWIINKVISKTICQNYPFLNWLQIQPTPQHNQLVILTFSLRAHFDAKLVGLLVNEDDSYHLYCRQYAECDPQALAQLRIFLVAGLHPFDRYIVIFILKRIKRWDSILRWSE